eukprot:39083_1
MAKCSIKFFWNMNPRSDLKRHIFWSISKRFKGKKPRKPRDPPPASSFLQQNRDKDFDPFISSQQFETDPNRGGKWTKIDKTWSKIQDDKLQASSPDILNQYSESQILPRTKGIKTLSKFIEQEPYKHRLEPETQIEIVAEDDNYIFVHKPAGIAVHGSEEYEYELNGDRKRKNSKTKTYYEIFMEYWYKTYPFFRFEPRLLHRLDKHVSGIMVFGKKWCAEEHFANLLNNNSDYFYGCGVKKCYIAVCKGIPNKEQGIIEGRIAKAHWNYKRFAIYNKKKKDLNNESSSHIKTEYKVIDTCQHGKIGICSLIIFTIHTGKRHQIRASASSLNTPIVGDVLYGGSKYNTLLLHSLFIGFEGIIDTKLLYAVSCLPKWSHLSNHFWSTKAQYHVKQHLDFLMTVPRPSKKPKFLQYSLRKERAGLKRQLEAGRNQILLPIDKEIVAIDDGKMKDNDSDKYDKIVRDVDKSGLDKMEEFVADNFMETTMNDHMKKMNKARKRIKPYERMDEMDDNVYDPLLDGAVPEHYFMD